MCVQTYLIWKGAMKVYQSGTSRHTLNGFCVGGACICTQQAMSVWITAQFIQYVANVSMYYMLKGKNENWGQKCTRRYCKSNSAILTQQAVTLLRLPGVKTYETKQHKLLF